jgi:ClpP class serine protease
MHQLEKLSHRNAAALVLIINSYGGSLGVAKNIAHTLKQLQNK